MQFNCSYTEIVSVSKLVPNPKNANKHPPEQIERLAKIIEFQGQRSPIVVSKRSGFITKGHGRLMAMQKLGWENVAVDYQDYLSEAQEYADVIADNEIARWAELDKEKMIKDITYLDLGDIDLLGLQIMDIDLDEVMPTQEIPNGVGAMDKLEKYLGKEFLQVKLEFNKEEYDEFISLAEWVSSEVGGENMSDSLLEYLRKCKN